MGEIADMMLDGTLCEGCGEYIDEGEAEGFPRYCSESCANDRSMTLNEFDEVNENTIEEIKIGLEANIEMLDEEADKLILLKKTKKARSLKNFIKQLKIFTESLT